MGKDWKKKRRFQSANSNNNNEDNNDNSKNTSKTRSFHHFPQHDFASCRGFGIVLGTCDAAKERETSKEMVNLYQEAIERLYPESLQQKKKTEEEKSDDQKEVERGEATASLSIAELMKQEINQVKKKKDSSVSTVTSIKTNVKGIALLKLLKEEYCPIELTKNIFQFIAQERRSYSRFIVRLIPLKYVFFPNEMEFQDHIEKILHLEMSIPLPPKPVKAITNDEENRDIEEKVVEPVKDEAQEALEAIGEKRTRDEEENLVDSEDQMATKQQKTETATINTSQPLSTLKSDMEITPTLPPQLSNEEKTRYFVQFKARNHNVLTKNFTSDVLIKLLHGYGIYDYRQPQVISVSILCVVIFVFFCFPHKHASLARHNNVFSRFIL